MRPSTLLALALATPVFLGTVDAHAQPVRQSREIGYDLPADIIVTSLALGVLFGTELAKGDLGPKSCRWCERGGRHDQLNRLDRGGRDTLRWNDPTTAARTSDILAFMLAPSWALGAIAVAGSDADASRQFPVDALVVVQAVAVGSVLNQAVKFVAARERPFAHAGAVAPEGYEGATPEARQVDENLSFYSGHTSISFGMAAASGTVASLREYRLAPLIWAAGLSIAAVTGYLRIAADKHYVTDVLTGAVMGAAAGILLPVVFHGRREEVAPSSATPPVTGMQTLGWSGAF